MNSVWNIKTGQKQHILCPFCVKMANLGKEYTIFGLSNWNSYNKKFEINIQITECGLEFDSCVNLGNKIGMIV